MTATMTDAIKETTERTRRIELLIVPGKSLGPFRLGSSLWDTINFLRERPLFFPSVELKYAQLDPLRHEFIISLPHNGIRLWFDGSLQRLRTIECFDPSKVKLVYQNSDVSSSKTMPTFLLIYKCFGPTYLGEFKAEHNLYTLNYPGLSFTFPIPQKYNQVYTNSSELPLEFPDGTTPIASKLYLFRSHDSNWEAAALPPISKTLAEINEGKSTKYGKLGRRELELVVVKVGHGVKLYFPVTAGAQQHHHRPTLSSSISSSSSSSISSSPPPVLKANENMNDNDESSNNNTSSKNNNSNKNNNNSNNSNKDNKFDDNDYDNVDDGDQDELLTSRGSSYQRVEILLRTTALQDILADLGKPSRVFYKEEDKMKIHSVADDGVAYRASKLETTMMGGSLSHGNDEDERDLSSANNATDYFLNYFHLGMDILIDGTEHVCKKVILHGNIPGHYDFQRYKRCPFKLVFPKSLVQNRPDPNKLLVDVDTDPSEENVPAHVINANMKITTIQQRIPWESSNRITTKATDETQLKQQKPVILTRGPNEQNPFGSTYLTGYSEGVVMEVMKNGYVPTVVLF